ncbi:hypothetical protein HanPSC8_Chr06g0232541 [Helianthus annuus]|nr:hypothetical protein HanPSC8_Chr06g0232541 [Helianthus annuus]
MLNRPAIFSGLFMACKFMYTITNKLLTTNIQQEKGVIKLNLRSKLVTMWALMEKLVVTQLVENKKKV